MKLTTEIKQVQPTSTSTEPTKYEIVIKGVGTITECELVKRKLLGS